MHTRELVQQVDELIERGRKLLAGQPVEEPDTPGDSIELRAFYHDVTSLTEEIRGFDHQSGPKTTGMYENGTIGLKEGLAVLEKQRTLILYSGEFGH